MINLTGKQFGKLTVVQVSETRLRNVLSWDCVCECGNLKTVAGPDLRTGDTTSCGCMKHQGTKKDITGNRYGKLVAVSRTSEKSSNGDYLWVCKCDCGNEHITTIGRLNIGSTQSCGCLKIEKAFERRTHGFKNNHKTYKVWCKMRDRCNNPNSPDYEDYGAKGIKVSPYFEADFMNFYNEIGEAPNDGKRWSVDRIDHTKGYEPGNIRWATDAQQARNKGKMSTNTSGKTGVVWDNKPWSDGGKKLYAKAQWSIYFGVGKHKYETKCFSVEKYGLLEAFSLACEYRERMIEKLNEQGYGYTENHGK